MTARRPLLPWVVWGVATLAYAIAIINRSTLAALGPATQQHFGIEATVLATFAVTQLIVYAAMQIPVGMLLDRFGATALILVGGVLMALGQLAMATVHEVSLAILARVLVGAGDACTFISVMRILPEWFSVKQLPTLSQVTALVGQVGQLVSVTPLALFIGFAGWTRGFIGVAAVCVLVALLGVFTLRDRPGIGTAFERMLGREGRLSREARSLGESDSDTALLAAAPPPTEVINTVPPLHQSLSFWQKTRGLLGIPGVRLAYWLHFTSPFATTVFVLLWGTPFLTGGVGLSVPAAKGLLSLSIIAGMAAGLMLGPITSRFVEKRVWVNFYVTLLIMVVWLVVLLWPGVPPTWLLTVLVVVFAFGGPASMISFEVARSHTPRSLAGFGTGMVNTGGFTSALLVILAIGLILDLQGAGSPELYTLDAFRWAFAVQVPFWVLGLVMILVEARRTRLWMQRHGRTLR